LRIYWNLGIGSLMLAYLIEWARQTGTIRKINLRVRVDNLAAIHLYEKYGFVQEGRVTREFYLHGQFGDVYVMGLQLDPPQALPAES
jgi:RimJ/RimL family protein N-acetyltransferase